jgi:hypothetical protein
VSVFKIHVLRRHSETSSTRLGLSFGEITLKMERIYLVRMNQCVEMTESFENEARQHNV